jgi:hypothetical protein
MILRQAQDDRGKRLRMTKGKTTRVRFFGRGVYPEHAFFDRLRMSGEMAQDDNEKKQR